MKPRYSLDRKAPRMRKAQFTKQVITRDLWKRFIKAFPEYKDLSWKEFYNGWFDIAKTFQDEAVTNPLGVKLGSYTGEIKVQYLPYKFESIDQALSDKMGQQMPDLNIMHRGKTPKIKWERRWAVKFNKILQYYAFNEDRSISKKANIYIRENPDKLRVSRNTLGGKSIWRQKMSRHDNKKTDN